MHDYSKTFGEAGEKSQEGELMIKTVTQYVVVCDNEFCDSVMRSGVDHHSSDRREQFKLKVKNRGWGGMFVEEEDPHHVCPSCRDFNEGVFK